ncbi:transcriptional regulator [Amycolatopsis sp. WAC 01375]|uniref:GAF and ANTAR domain-containing protein n=1 Tax=Amycolatopsis sp. WAC 01375 TaxID=2203194 RepID=UPI000F7A6781|nr:GAF and ANTAR domain-containing protein [Amycolatopsis sp. WAC 01375]RSM78090.1 transcriptional regulator [Amycolatopsis sp. WAC 01375]
MTEKPQEIAVGETSAAMRRERLLARTFVELADTLVDDFDVADFLRTLVEQCVRLMEVSAAGVVLADAQGRLRMAAASSERAGLLETLAVQTEDGPCIDCLRDGRPMRSTDLREDAARWPQFATAAAAAGFRAAEAVPMRLRGMVVGSLTLLHTEPVREDADRTALSQALADVATIGLLQQRAIVRGGVLTEQLQSALNSRVIIEQAKGVLSARSHDPDMEHAFTALRGYARSHNLRLADLSREVADGAADIDAILAHASRSRS